MKKILIAMQHNLQQGQTEELLESGFQPTESEAFNALKPELSNINFDADLHELADKFVSLLEEEKFDAVLLPIGSPAFNFVLAQELAQTNIQVLFAHSQRLVTLADDGSKNVVFVHQGFIFL